MSAGHVWTMVLLVYCKGGEIFCKVTCKIRLVNCKMLGIAHRLDFTVLEVIFVAKLYLSEFQGTLFWLHDCISFPCVKTDLKEAPT